MLRRQLRHQVVYHVLSPILLELRKLRMKVQNLIHLVQRRRIQGVISIVILVLVPLIVVFVVALHLEPTVVLVFDDLARSLSVLFSLLLLLDHHVADFDALLTEEH